MKNILWMRLTETLVIGLIGGLLFYLGSLPLPWVLGPMISVLLWQGLTTRNMYCPTILKNGGLLVLGTFFGLYFTMNTILTVGPYLIPYIIVTMLLIFISIVNSIFITKWINIDKMTSVFGAIPGGLTEMVIASESLKANSSLVAIFQTVRLLTVLFLVPFIIVHSFTNAGTVQTPINQIEHSFISWSYLWYLIPIITGYLLRNVIPAGVVIIPLILTATLNISPVEIAPLPPLLLIAAQIVVGINLGKSISFQDLKLGGKYCFVYFGLAVTLIFISFGLGTLLAMFTSLSLPTAILSIAPGGLIEMVLTAASVGADPAIVSALQLIRIFFIIVFVPPFLKWYFKKREVTSAT